MLGVALTAAIAAAVASSRIGDACTPVEVRSAVAAANVRRLGNAGGGDVVLVSLTAFCMCGNVNCPWLVVRVGHPGDVLLSTYAFEVGVERGAEALPRLRESAHDSALITDQTLDAYRNGTYVAVAVERVRGDNGARKPDTIPVRFAPGTSSARLRGKVAVGWYDQYAFDAARGQHLTIGNVAGGVALSLFDPQGGRATELQPGVALTLPRGGTFRLLVDGTGENEAPYALTLSIR